MLPVGHSTGREVIRDNEKQNHRDWCATIAYTLSNEDIATEIVLIDINKQKAEGEVMDIIQGTCFRDPISIKSGDYEDAKDSNIVIITSGVARKPGQSRLELAQTNVNITKSIIPEITKYAPDSTSSKALHRTSQRPHRTRCTSSSAIRWTSSPTCS